MSELNSPIETEVEKPEKPKRFRWIDQARGFTMFYLVFTIVFPSDWKRLDENVLTNILHYLFGHASASADYMTLFDIGAAAFIFLLGMMLPLSYRRREQKYGKKAAIKHVAVRYGMLSLIGLLIMLLNNFELIEQETGIPLPILSWDVVPAIAVAGWITFAFIAIDDPKKKLIIGYAISVAYQVLMVTTFFKDYAIESIHGGVFGGIMGYGSISIIASALGDYMFFGDTEENQKYKNMLIFGLVNIAIGIAISFIPGWEPSKRQVSLAHNIISIGVSAAALWVFAWFDRKKDVEMTYLRAYGMNPFFVYFIVELPNLLIKETIGTGLGFDQEWIGNVILTVVYITYTSIIMLRLYKKKKVISTTKAAAIFLITAVVLVALILIVAPDIIL